MNRKLHVLPLLILVLTTFSVAAAGQSRPRTEGSMIGYVDNAIVGSQFHIRFDAGFDLEHADRAEYFYGKCGCYASLPPGSPAFDASAPGPGPGVPTGLDFQQFYVHAEYAPNSRVSIFGELPIRHITPQSFNPTGLANWKAVTGVGDLRLGAKMALNSTDDRVVAFQFRVYTPTGDAKKGAGTDHVSVEPAILLFQRLGSRGALESQFGWSAPIGGSEGVPTSSSEKFSGDVLFWGVGPSVELYQGNSFRVAPVVELVGWTILNGFTTDLGGPVAGVSSKAEGTIANLKVGSRFSIGNRNSLYVGYGRALTDERWYKHVLRIEHRISF